MRVRVRVGRLYCTSRFCALLRSVVSHARALARVLWACVVFCPNTTGLGHASMVHISLSSSSLREIGRPILNIICYPLADPMASPPDCF